MLDQQHGHVLRVAHAADLAAQHVDLVVVEAGGRLVEQQQLGAAGQRAGQLDALAHGERQAARRQRARTAFRSMKAMSSRARSVMRRSSGADRGQAQGVGDEAGRGAAVAADLDVVEHAHAVEQGDVLEGAADAELGDGVARLAEDRAALEQDVARRWGCRAGDRQLKSVVLPAPLGPIRPAIWPGADVEGDAVERDDAAEAHRDVCARSAARSPLARRLARKAACATMTDVSP